MANEIQAQAVSGLDYIALVRNAAAQPRNVVSAAFEAWDDDNIPSYAVPLTEQGTSGYFVGDFPAGIAAGRYFVEVREQVGLYPSLDDVWEGGSPFDWDGTAEVTLASLPEAPSASAVASEVLSRALETGITVEQALRGIFAEAIGSVEYDADTDEFVLLSADGTKERGRATITSGGVRTVTAKDLS